MGRPAASEHLARLLAGELVTVVIQGRHRYYRLASPAVAAMLESMALVAPARPARTLSARGRAAALRPARSCYDHLAGVAGVRLHDGLLDRAWLVPARGGYDLTAEGVAGLQGWGMDPAPLRAARRSFARPCLDWTERQPHLAGALAAGLLRHLLAEGWVLRRAGSPRALVVTALGERRLSDLALPATDSLPAQ